MPRPLWKVLPLALRDRRYRADRSRIPEQMVEPQMSPVLYEDALASEAAAFSHEELREELVAAGLRDLDRG